jgi:hypothetical protein
MNVVEVTGWTQQMLEDVLTKMRSKVVRGRTVEADEPKETRYTGDWGNKLVYYACPAVEPLDDMLHTNYPTDLETI